MCGLFGIISSSMLQALKAAAPRTAKMPAAVSAEPSGSRYTAAKIAAAKEKAKEASFLKGRSPLLSACYHRAAFMAVSRSLNSS